MKINYCYTQNMDDSRKILSGKKPNKNEYILYDSTQVKFKNRGKYSIVFRLRIVLPQAEGEGRLGPKRVSLECQSFSTFYFFSIMKLHEFVHLLIIGNIYYLLIHFEFYFNKKLNSNTYYIETEHEPQTNKNFQCVKKLKGPRLTR